MKKTLIHLCMGLAGLAAAVPSLALEPGQAAPELRLALPDAATLAALKGQVVYLDFWASYCGPCRRSFPWMNQMQARYGERGLRVVAVNLDSKRADAERFLAQVPAQFAIAYDPAQESPQRFGVKAMPSALLIGADGRVLRMHSGFQDEQRAELEAAITQALAARR
ncbi:TlpA disulfide reductase family protein [Variovorax sp. YR752]|uniref:TlpA family protein disulfide reductase n=1 Tax=Variovorax sp. YR752 TaxID=1884383 RepID=UPI0031377495